MFGYINTVQQTTARAVALQKLFPSAASDQHQAE